MDAIAIYICCFVRKEVVTVLFFFSFLALIIICILSDNAMKILVCWKIIHD